MITATLAMNSIFMAVNKARYANAVLNKTDWHAYCEQPAPADLRHALACVWVMRLLDPTQLVEALAADLGFSERQLRRRFLASAGYGPKILQRVLRLRRSLAGERHDLARAALDAEVKHRAIESELSLSALVGDALYAYLDDTHGKLRQPSANGS